MEIILNEKSTQVDPSLTLYQLLKNQEILSRSGVAVALNFEVIPREKWGETSLKEKDQILVVQATQGG